MQIALQMDPLEGINSKTDTSLALGAEACARGFTVWHYTPQAMSLIDGKVTALATRVKLQCTDTNYYEVLETKRISLSDMGVILLRQDPPFDMAYLTSTYMLEMLPPSTKVVNNPFHVRNNPEKWLPLSFAQYMPETLISRNAEEIHAFWKTHKDIVVKPLYSYGGRAVFHIAPESDTLGSVLEILFSSSSEPVIAQRYLPEVREHESRVILIDGKVAGVMGRIPAAGDVRSNLRVGGTAVKRELSPKQKEICDVLSPMLKEKGLTLVGLDLIGDYLNEINITSPTGIRQINALYGIALEKQFWDAVEKL